MKNQIHRNDFDDWLRKVSPAKSHVCVNGCFGCESLGFHDGANAAKSKLNYHNLQANYKKVERKLDLSLGGLKLAIPKCTYGLLDERAEMQSICRLVLSEIEDIKLANLGR